MALNNDGVMQWKLIDLINSWEIADILNVYQADGTIFVNCIWGNTSTPGTLCLAA